ncbi:MAG: uL15 family ribosomal protein [Patescibacteria group bacterium]
MLTLTNLKPKPRKTKRRVGRGNASGRGTYSSRGLKGQKSRSGGKGGLKLMGLKQTFKKIPKVKGFKSLNDKLLIINLKDLETTYKDGQKVKLEGYKVLGSGKLSKKLIVCASAFSKVASEAITKAGGETKTCGKK